MAFHNFEGGNFEIFEKLRICLELLKHQYHPEISEEVRRQIVRTEPRDDEMEEPPAHIMEEMMNAI